MSNLSLKLSSICQTVLVLLCDNFPKCLHQKNQSLDSEKNKT